MKQASFKICEVKKMKMTEKMKMTMTDERTSSTNEGNQQNISSKKPIKHVENIYYFRSSS